MKKVFLTSWSGLKMRLIWLYMYTYRIFKDSHINQNLFIACCVDFFFLNNYNPSNVYIVNE